MHHVSLLVGSAIATSLLAKYGGRAQDLENYVMQNVTWYSTSAMASIDLTVLETQASTESNRHSTNIVVVKGTAHAGLKEIRTKATAIAVANFDVAV